MPILTLFKTRTVDDPIAKRLHAAALASWPSLRSVNIEVVIRCEGPELSIADLARIGILFANPVIETAFSSSRLDLSRGPVIEVAYKRAMTDPEMPTALHAFQAVGVQGVTWVRLAHRYQFSGVDEIAAREIAARHLYNPEVQVINEAQWDTLIPQAEALPVQFFSVAGMDKAELKTLAKSRKMTHLTDAQLLAIQHISRNLRRALTDVELEHPAAAWSDHCFHTTFKALGLLPCIRAATEKINHPLVLSCFVDNGGVMELFGGWAVIIKGETHISPTFAGDPYGGIMTKHGGVIRDVIGTGLGGWPVCGTTIMATTDPRTNWNDVPEGAFHPARVIQEAIRGTHEYTNPMGIPMACSAYLMHPRNWKGFALGHSIGIIPEDKAQKGAPVPGDFIFLIGGPTGNDGIHGATVSSDSMTHQTAVVDAAHVQIGAPIEQRKFMEAVPILRDQGCIRAITDCGAAGLASAAGEMGSSCGIWVNLAWVRLKTAGLSCWQIWLSESQERMVIAVPPGRLDLALDTLDQYDVPSDVIGMFTNTGRCVVAFDDELDQRQWLQTPALSEKGIVEDLPYEFLTDDCPLPRIEVADRLPKPKPFQPPIPTSEQDWIDLVVQHLGHFHLADQSWAAHRFDQTVQGNTFIPYLGGEDQNMPDDLFAAAPVPGKRFALGVGNAVNQFYGEVSPAGLGRLVFLQAVTKLVAAGFDPKQITACANVYTPKVLDNPTNARALIELVKEGYVPASEQLGVPIITGKDSSSGTFVTKSGERIDAPLTLDILTVGRMADGRLLRPKAFGNVGERIILFCPGLMQKHLGGSVLFDLYGQRGNELPIVDLAQAVKGFSKYHSLARKGVVGSRSAVVEGGLIRRLFEMAIGSRLGFVLNLPFDSLFSLFGEMSCGIVFTTKTDDYKWLGHDAVEIGWVTPNPDVQVIDVSGDRLFTTDIATLSTLWAKTFREVVS
ncbi:MAG: hypothetical protein HYW51_01645 [Candidatus Doudnabacteria bacterium]|nr:hypothetical protein [Candidatus Doudnabacteria bacterium]